MSSDISAIHRSLKSINLKEKKPFNFNKFITVVLFFGILIIGLVYLSAGNSGITGKAIGNLNSCTIENMANPLAIGSFYCTHEYKNKTLTLTLKYSDPYTKAPVKMKNIKINSCNPSSNQTLYPGKIYTIELLCDNIGVSEEMTVSFINQENGIEHNLKGKIMNFI